MLNSKKKLFHSIKRDIYCFADNKALCQKLLLGGARIIQFRAKEINDSIFAANAQEMFSLMKSYSDSIFIINDRVDIAIQIKADGIHVGMEDEDFQQVINRVPRDMIVGVSVENVEQAIAAESAGATYVGPGAVFSTPTKSDVPIIGIDVLREIVRAVNIPVVAIGGITLENIDQVIETGAKFYAVISQINNAKNITARLNEFFKIIKYD